MCSPTKIHRPALYKELYKCRSMAYNYGVNKNNTKVDYTVWGLKIKYPCHKN